MTNNYVEVTIDEETKELIEKHKIDVVDAVKALLLKIKS